MLLGLLRASGGEARLLGGDPWHDAVALHRRLAYVPGDVNLWPNLSGGEAIDLLGRLRGGLDPQRRAELLERFELDPTKKGRAYSKGNRQKVALVAALASDVELLVLDEPTSGLDPLKEAVFQACIEEARDGGPDRAALEPHPRRGRGAVRPRDDHPRRQDGRDRHAVRAAPPHAHLDRGRDRAASPPASTQLPGVHDLHVEDHRARFDVDTAHLDETVRRLAGLRRAQPDEHAADARGALPAPLRRRDRMSRYAGTGAMLRLALRRERLRIPVYLVLFTLLVAETALQSEETYPTAGRARRVRRHRGGQPRPDRDGRAALRPDDTSAATSRGSSAASAPRSSR